MSRSERKKAKTASAILDAAEVLFRQRGFQTTTIDEIAERADVSVGSVYVHFENKANLYLALGRACPRDQRGRDGQRRRTRFEQSPGACVRSG